IMRILNRIMILILILAGVFHLQRLMEAMALLLMISVLVRLVWRLLRFFVPLLVILSLCTFINC
ncbi:hypothetical protein, partial [Alistipes putredinis]|uniref:hypothetical protein n=3 Tax=Alistipes TaxID=239759 RepID=UPI003AAACDFF